MKQFILLLAFTQLAITINAQIDKSEGFIDYDFKHYYDTTNINKVHNEVLRMYYNANISVYKSLSRTLFDSTTKSNIEKSAQDGKFTNLNLGQLPNGSIEQFFTFINEQKTITFRKFLKVNYLTTDTMKITWQLQYDTLNILGYNCQKAIGNFKGRTYIAWFTSNLPYPIGPWKLKGLPGMILKADDIKGHVSFQAKGINTYVSIIDIKLPENSKYTTQKELMSAIKAYRENPNAFQNDGSINIEAKGSSMLKKTTKANNPVELID
jgi:GLPGLI family protein